MAKYSQGFKLRIVQEYLKGHLGYSLLAQKYGIPSSTPIKQWVQTYKAFGEEGLQLKTKKEEYPVQFKLDVLNFMKQTGASYQDTAIRFNMNHPSLIVTWNSKFLKEGVEGLKHAKGRPSMSKKTKDKAIKVEKTMSREEQLERENELLRLEVAYLKKVEGFSREPRPLPRKAQAAISFELKGEGFRLKDVLKRVAIPEATYHYHIKQMKKEDPDQAWKTLILETFEKHEGRYGYRRIHADLKAQGHKINHKKVQRIMNELNLKCIKFVRKSRYKSYKGTVGKIAKNRLNRRFNTPYALQKLVTDVTEFKCTNQEKLYLSPIMDLYNGEIIGFSMSKRPTLEFVMDSLKKALPNIHERAEYRTTIHSDQGWHYQHNSWVKTLKLNKIFQSMSRKATCADNAAMENFFGLLKQEMYYGEKLISYEALQKKIEKYIDYYNNDRIKQKLAGMSPVKYRTHASQLAA